jgi:hypothetical protein
MGLRDDLEMACVCGGSVATTCTSLILALGASDPSNIPAY